MKKTDYYGVMLTELESMKLMKFINTNGIAINTLTKEHRKEIAMRFASEVTNNRGTDFTPECLEAMNAWLKGSGHAHFDLASDVDDEEILSVIDKYYEGGSTSFLIDFRNTIK